jgi:hypothetical protein
MVKGSMVLRACQDLFAVSFQWVAGRRSKGRFMLEWTRLLFTSIPAEQFNKIVP